MNRTDVLQTAMNSTEAALPSTRSADPPVESGSLRGEWISTTEEFEQLGAEWMELFERAGCENAFLSFDWMFTWWKHWAKGRRLAIITVRNACGNLVGLAPFYVTRSFPDGLNQRRVSFLADNHTGSDYLNILTEPDCEEAAVEAIVQTLAIHHSKWDYIELRDAEDSPLFERLSARLEQGGLTAHRAPASVCHHVPLPASFEKYLAGISANLRCNFRRRSRAIQSDGHFEFGSLSSAEDLERHFPDLLRLHGMRFQQRGCPSAFLEPGVPAFHLDVVKRLAARGWARLFLIRVNGEIVAILYGFSMGKTFQFYQCGMHTDWLKNGVGQLMIGYSIQEAIRAGHREFDFLRGDESYKTQWAEDFRRTITVRYYDRRPASLAALAAFRAIAALRRARSVLR